MSAGFKYEGPNGAFGELAGTGAAISVLLTFKPIKVKIVNRTRLVNGEWTIAMPQDSASLLIDSGAGTSDLSFVTSNAITSGSSGFILGSNASLNTASDVIYWEAERGASATMTHNT